MTHPRPHREHDDPPAGSGRPMRVGTWNLEGRWTPAHRDLLVRADCDLWLLTEVPHRFDMPDGDCVRSAAMGAHKAWAAVWGRDALERLDAPHPAAALVGWREIRVCACVLPWRGARPYWPDSGESVAAITSAAIGALRTALVADGPVGLGGDLNHALHGPEWAGTLAGRAAIEMLLAELGLEALTRDAPHRREGALAIDHIAVPAAWGPGDCRRIDARGLSDHDAYPVTVGRAASAGASP